MIKECGGLPLAVVVLGGILAKKQSVKEWEKVKESIKSYIRRGEGMGQDGGGVSKVLGFSYHELPYHLKYCFLYLGQFKEDTEIETERLYQLWNAESMIMSENRREGETMIDVAEGYLEELAQRYMVQVQPAEAYMGVGRFKSCRLHDLMRDLCLSIGKQENFFRTYGDPHEKNQEVAESSSYLTDRTRRAVVHLSKDTTNPPFDKETCQCLRSLFLFTAEKYNKSRMVKSMQKDFMMLRVLHIEGLDCHGDRLSVIKAAGKLRHLQYLSFENFGLPMLPSSINKLKHLQTLYFKGPIYRHGIVFPWSANVLRNMSRLQHLYLPPYYSIRSITFKLKFDGLSKLETLENFNSSWCDFKSLRKLTNLRKLTAKLNKIEEMEAIIVYLKSSACKHMRHSEIRQRFIYKQTSEKICSVFKEILKCPRLSKFVLDCHKTEHVKRLPTYDQVGNFSQSLLSLDFFWGLELDEDPMPTLEKLPKLQVLILRRTFRGKKMVCSNGGFPQLISLTLEELRFLEEWDVQEGAMSNLSRLSLCECWKLKEVPRGLKHIKSLREFELEGMPEEFNRRIKIVDGIKGQDFDIISHVPSVITRASRY